MSEYILGIDLGTTNSEVAVYRDGEAVLLKQDGEKIMPSVVGLDTSGNIITGRSAWNQAILAPERTVKSIKRLMGSETTVHLGDREYRPEEISAMILKALRQRAEASLGTTVNRAVITVPAFFNDTQREATRKAGELAGLDVVRIINEPTAASLVYQHRHEDSETVLVYDLGGGTFDVSIVRMETGVVEVLASHGDTHLGGDDFDQLLFNKVRESFQKKNKFDLSANPVSKSRVIRAVEQAKIQLSTEPFAQIEEEFIGEKGDKPLHLKMEIDRLEYNSLIFPLLEFRRSRKNSKM